MNSSSFMLASCKIVGMRGVTSFSLCGFQSFVLRMQHISPDVQWRRFRFGTQNATECMGDNMCSGTTTNQRRHQHEIMCSMQKD